MHHTISNIDKTINLQQYIDNRKGDKYIGLKSITYGIGWYNITNGIIKKKDEHEVGLPKGNYSFYQLSDIFESIDIELDVHEVNGMVTLITNKDLELSKEITDLLGFDKNKFEAGTHFTDRQLDFAIYKSLYVHLEQINTSYNYLDGRPSTLLAVIPVENKEFGDIVTFRLENPEYKLLVNDTITELKVSLRDSSGNIINNKIQTSCVLEIISK